MYQHIRSWKLSGLILVAIIVQIGFGLRYWQGQLDGDVTERRPLVTSPHDVGMPSSLESLYAVAVGHASEWRPDARLMTASLQVDWPVDGLQQDQPRVPGGGWATFAFYSESAGEPEVMSVLLERYSGAIIQERVTAWPGEDLVPATLSLEAVNTGSLTALVSAELTSGQDFRLACPDRRHQTHVSLTWADHRAEPATTAPPATGATPVAAGRGTPMPSSGAPSLVWVVSYEDSATPDRYPLRVTIDASTGGILSVRGGDPTC